MTASQKDKWKKAQESLPSDARHLLMELKEDYEQASAIHVPDWTGGPNPGILSELIRMGWRKAN